MEFSLDCKHVVWKNCPAAWQGSFKGKEKKCTIVLETLCDYHLWFRHVAFGFAGTMNDSCILNLSPLFDSFLSGSFEELESFVAPFEISEEEFDKLFVLVDGIYSQYSHFVKELKIPLTERKQIHSMAGSLPERQ
jgi:Plant transposon protein